MAMKTAMTPSRSFVVSTSNSNASAALNICGAIRLVASVDTFVSIGSAATTTASLFLPAGIMEYFEVPQTAAVQPTTINAILASGTGSLYVTEMN